MNKFIEWVKQTDLYKELEFIYGERLFIVRDGVFAVSAIRLAYEAYQQQQPADDTAQALQAILLQNSKLIEQNNQLIQINNEQNAQINELLIQLTEDEEPELALGRSLD